MNMSSSRVLTMQYLPGIKVTDVKAMERAGYDRKVLAKRLAESYLIQLCEHGFYHCDPHPGNLACDSGYPGGRLIYYDFGMMSELNQNIRKNFANLILAMYDNNVQGAYDAFCQLDVIDQKTDQGDVKKVLRVFLEEFNSLVYTDTGVYTSQLSLEEQDMLVRKRRLKLGANLWVKLQSEGLFQLPSTFTFIARAFNNLDGVGKSLDSRYDLFKFAQPFVSDLVQKEAGLSNAEIKFWKSSLGRFLRQIGIGRKGYKRSDDGIPLKGGTAEPNELLREQTSKNRIILNRLVLQNQNSMNVAKTTLFLVLMQLGENIGRSVTFPIKSSILQKLWAGFSGATVTIALYRIVLDSMKSTILLNKVEGT